jgi:hypothetical protein
MTVDEQGRELGGFATKGDSGYHLLSVYTTRSLTFQSDCTEALRRITEMIQSSPGDQYLSEYGCWKTGLTFQLLWIRVGPSSSDGNLPDLPTWSWAATSGEKTWPWVDSHYYRTTCEARQMPEEMTMLDTGHLEIVGPMSNPLAVCVEHCDFIQDRLSNIHAS